MKPAFLCVAVGLLWAHQTMADASPHVCDSAPASYLNDCTGAKATLLIRDLLPDRGDANRFADTAWLACNGACLIGTDSQGSVVVSTRDPKRHVTLDGMRYIGDSTRTWCQTNALPFADASGRVHLFSLTEDLPDRSILLNVPPITQPNMSPGLSCDGKTFVFFDDNGFSLTAYDVTTGQYILQDQQLITVSPTAAYAAGYAETKTLVITDLRTGQVNALGGYSRWRPVNVTFTEQEDHVAVHEPDIARISFYRLSDRALVASIHDISHRPPPLSVTEIEGGYRIEHPEVSRNAYIEYLQSGAEN